jgi:hypothetical protein
MPLEALGFIGVPSAGSGQALRLRAARYAQDDDSFMVTRAKANTGILSQKSAQNDDRSGGYDVVGMHFRGVWKGSNPTSDEKLSDPSTSSGQATGTQFWGGAIWGLG